jgi:hypothetical protein
MSAVQRRICGYAFVVGLGGIVFGLLGSFFILMFLGQMSNGVIHDGRHLSYPQFFALTGVIGFGCGFNFGRNEARRKFLQ